MRRNAQAKYRLRTGTTLFEFVMVVAATSLLATITTQLLYAMIQQQSAATLQLSLGNTLMRVEKQLRDDVHNATDAEIYLGSTLQLTRAGGQHVEWSRTKDWLVRKESVDGGNRTNYFDLLPELEHSFEAKPLGVDTTAEPPSPKFVTLRLEPKLPNDAGEVPQRDPRFPTFRGRAKIIAELSRDLRFTKPHMRVAKQ